MTSKRLDVLLKMTASGKADSFAWYALATGVDPWRIAEANLMISFGLRPAVIVALVGLVPCGFVIWRNRQGALNRQVA